MTIGFGKCVSVLDQQPTSRLPDAVARNLEGMIQVRDNSVHFVNSNIGLSKHVLELGTAAVKNFIELSKAWFNHDWSRYNLYLMPIGFISGPSLATALVMTRGEQNVVTFLSTLTQGGAVTAVDSFNVALELDISFKKAEPVNEIETPGE